MIYIFRRGGCIKNTSFYKFLVFMKFIILFTIICTFQSFASTYAQKVKINLEMTDVNIRNILQEIKSQTEFDFVYNSEEINSLSKKISINVKNAAIDEVLKRCLSNTEYKHIIKGKIIVIVKNRIKNTPTVQQKGVKIKGKVTDQKGVPLPGVSILIVGTKTGISTDIDGNFSIILPSTKGISLKFTFIGMKDKTVKIGEKTTINVQLVEKSESLNEVVVTGMEVLKAEHMTGAATVVKSHELQDQGISSIDELFEGKIAGLNSTTISGAVGTRSKIAIRGENSLSGNTEPLWILDGLPMTSGVPENNSGDYAGTIMQDGVGNIMPEDIASITILKDAAGAAIYGAKAANGVIVITTKKGFRSKTKFSYSGNLSYSTTPTIDLDFMNSSEKLRYERALVEDFGLNYAPQAGRGGMLWKKFNDGYMSYNEYKQEVARLSSINTNWFDHIFKASQSQSHNLSIRGGNETLSYYTSISYTNKKGILEPNTDSNSGLRMNLEYRPSKKLIISLGFSGNVRTNKNHASRIDPFNYAIFANTYERPYDENGNYAYDLSYLPNNYTEMTSSGYKYAHFNILNELENTKKRTDGLDLSMTVNIRYNILPGLSVQSIFRKDASQNSGITEVYPNTYTSFVSDAFVKNAFKDQDVPPAGYNNGKLSETSGKSNSWSIRNQVDYSLSISDKHLFSILLANEITSRKFNNFGYSSPIYDPEYRITGIPYFENEELTYEEMSSAIASMFNTSDGQDRTVSFLGQIRYSFKDKYVVNFNARADGADIIGDANKYTPLWSLGGRWNLHKEGLLEKYSDLISNFSIRGSYGFTGNIDRTAYPFSTIIIGSDRYMNENYAAGFSFPNPSVRWAKKVSRNIGLNISFLKNSISFDGNYYTNKTDDVLTSINVPVATGRSIVTANGGVLKNKGIELALNIRWIKTKNFSFYTSANIARNKNVISKAEYGLKSYKDAIKTNISMGGVMNIMGKETGGIYGWKFAGVHPNSGLPMYYLTDAGKKEYAKILDKWDSFTTNNQEYYKESGMIPTLTEIPDMVAISRDLSPFKTMLMESMQYIGRTNPKYVGGFSTSMKYRKFSFDTYWTYKLGHMIQSFDDRKNAPTNDMATYETGGKSSDFYVSGTNREKKYLYRWRNKGDITNVPNFRNNNDYYATIHTTNNYQKGDYLRLKSVSLKYRMTGKFAKRFGFDNMNISFTAKNLLTFTKYKGLDVGTGSTFAYPTAKEFNFRLSLGF